MNAGSQILNNNGNIDLDRKTSQFNSLFLNIKIKKLRDNDHADAGQKSNPE